MNTPDPNASYAEVMHEQGIRYAASLPYALASIGDELIFESIATMALAKRAADRAVEDYRARKAANHV